MAGKGSKLQLLSQSYDQRVGDALVRRSYGEVFEAQSDAEYERLTSRAAALDPAEAVKRESERIERERESLQAQIAALEAQSESLSSDLPPDPASLKGQDLDDALQAKGLSTSGTVAEKRARLAAADDED